MIPIPLHTKPLHFRALCANPFIRKGPAFGAELIHRDVVFVFAFFTVLLLNLPFNRQPMTIPAMHIGAVKAKHIARACHHIFQSFIESMPNMNVAIGIRRPIMQDKCLPPRPFFTQALIKANFIPSRQKVRFPFGQPRFHRKRRFRQEQRLPPIPLIAFVILRFISCRPIGHGQNLYINIFPTRQGFSTPVSDCQGLSHYKRQSKP